MESVKYSVIVPVYRNEASIGRLLEALGGLAAKLQNRMEAVLVVDGSPDASFERLQAALPTLDFPVQLLAHSRNFGSFPAIRSGLIHARGEFFAVMAADLQEPPELALAFFKALEEDECDVTLGTRSGRDDPFLSRLASSLFWRCYRRWVVPEMPEGGVDMFGCNRVFRDELVKLEESRSSLVSLIFWLGYRRLLIPYRRNERLEGKSGWTFRKKLDYMTDSIFAFTDYPIRLLIRAGVLGCMLSLVLGAIVLIAALSGRIAVPGYAATMLVVLFFGAVNVLGLGLIGNYAWRGYENTKRRPLSIVARKLIHDADTPERRTDTPLG